MSETIETGVADKNLSVHGYNDFYITHGSVIQGNIGVNPSMTNTTAAEYCMSTIPSREDRPESDISKQLKLLETEWKKRK